MKMGFIKEGKLLMLYKLVLTPLETTSQATSNTPQGGRPYLHPRGTNPTRG